MRWAIVWQYAVHANATGAKELHPTALAQLSEAEAGMMRASTKSRATAGNKVRRLIVQANLTEGEASWSAAACELGCRGQHACWKVALLGCLVSTRWPCPRHRLFAPPRSEAMH